MQKCDYFLVKILNDSAKKPDEITADKVKRI